jgi:hypothetical protein
MRALLVVLLACGHPAAPAQPPAEKSIQVNKPGEAIELHAVLPDGYVTVVDFWSESCGACVIVGGMLAVQTAKDTAVVIRKVDVGDGDTPVAKQFKVGALPHYNVYDRHKKLRYQLVGNECLKAPELAKQLAAE